MTSEGSYDRKEGGGTIDKAKESRRYDKATEAILDQIASLKNQPSVDLAKHPLSEIYIQELVRCETIRLMKDEGLHRTHQVSGRVLTHLDERFGTAAARTLKPFVDRWVRKFKKQLGGAAEVTQWKSLVDDLEEELRRPAKDELTGSPEDRTRRGRYEIEVFGRLEGDFELVGTPVFGNFDADRLFQYLRTEPRAGFPVEMDFDGHMFLIDYDGSILTYGQNDAPNRVKAVAQAFTQALEQCFT
jgi:hypothetical protein